MELAINLILVFIISLFLGSFYNVVGLRILKGEDFIRTPSACTSCNHKLGPLDLVPVFSWVFLGGKCRYCKAKVSKIYPFGELLTATSYTLIFYSFNFQFSLEMAIHLVFITFMIIATVTDLKEKIVPDKLIVTGIVVIFILRAFNQVDFINYLLGGLISFGILFAIFLLSGEKMGGADVKIYALIGISIGLLGAINSLFYASIVALILNLDKLKKKNRKKEIPFLPFITIGVLLVYIGG